MLLLGLDLGYSFSRSISEVLVMFNAILRLPQVKVCVGLSRSSIYLAISQGRFPEPVRLGAGAVGWPAAEIAALNAARIAGQSDEEIRLLITRFHANRKAAQQ